MKSEAGLAEWTSKIKAMQQQVDADEEAEQRSLEEEIAASRLARLHRSRGVGHSSRTNSLDLSKLKDDIGASSHSRSATKGTVERPSRQVGTPQNGSPASGPSERPSASTEAVKSLESRFPVSLAAFMGGRAAGPRLNKHAPQQDAHDPTLFQQREFDRIAHPIFGAGGVAMPGIAGSSEITSKPTVRASELPIATKASEGETPVRLPEGTRDRTITPSLPSSGSMSVKTGHEPVSHLPSKLSPSTSSANLSRTSSGSHTISNRTGDIRDTAPAQHSTDASSSPYKSPVLTPSRARHIIPEPRSSLREPQILTSQTPSKAFLRPPAQKEVTPSISRLQGRGFVRSMVNVSAQLESAPATTVKEAERVHILGGQRPSVLDRWQPNVSSKTAALSASLIPLATRKSVATDPPSTIPEDIQDTRLAGRRKSSKGLAAFPSSSDGETRSANIVSMPPSRECVPLMGLGSATTLHVYKPTPVQAPSVDELGYHNEKNTPNELPAQSRPPLSHPTRERARKPQKIRLTGSDILSSPLMIFNDIPVVIPQASSRQLRGSQRYEPMPASPQPRNQTDNPMLDPSIPNQTLSQKGDEFLDTKSTSQCPGDGSDGCAIDVSSRTGTEAVVLGNYIKPETIPQVLRDRERTTLQLLDPPETASTSWSGSAKVPEPVQLAILSESVEETRPTSTPHAKQEGRMQLSTRHGGCATVVDVTQALNELESIVNATESVHLAHLKPGNVRRCKVASSHVERPKTSYEKYSSIVLPPLPEEDTSKLPYQQGNAHHKEFGDEPWKTLHSTDTATRINEGDPSEEHHRSSLPSEMDIDILVERRARFSLLNTDSTTLSVEVLSIIGTTALMLHQDQAIFHDTEILAIIYRSKSRSTGLVSTVVWGWEGKRGKLGEREQRKLQDLGKRYGTATNIVHQDSEPFQLVHVLGGRLVIRQGPRVHWTPENTTMHLIRSQGGAIFVDEKDLGIYNICSAFSYCISILDSVYVWYGRGSTTQERKVALEYGKSLANVSPIELSEDNRDNDEMFWTILGNEDYANADYWKWRNNSCIIDPLIWRIETELAHRHVTAIDYIMSESRLHDFVYIIDCIWEIYIMVGCNARDHKQDIELALHIASGLCLRVSSERPYLPTAHLLLLPSRVPRDLRLNIRGLDEFALNNGDIPDYMNIVSSTEALHRLRKSQDNLG